MKRSCLLTMAIFSLLTTTIQAQVADSKYKDLPGFGLISNGRILLQNHGNKVFYKNIKIKSVSPAIGYAFDALDLNDRSGKKTKLPLWFTPGDDVFGYVTRSEKMVNPVYQLLDGNAPVCHFHSKLMQKEPRVCGAWEWRQDMAIDIRTSLCFRISC